MLVTFSCLVKALAADVGADFSAANDLYAKGKFPEAAAAYENILQNRGQSASLLFNCGNAEFKSGHLGKAIAAYRQAELLTPQDPELRANLAFVRTQVQGATLRDSRWRNWISSLTLNEEAVLAAVMVWALFGLLTARQLRPALAARLRGVTRLVLALTVFSCAILGLQAASHFNSPVAVVTVGQATARTGPLDDAQVAFTARDGVEMRVLDRHDDWVQAADGAGKIGWFSTKQVQVLPGA
ncbi:MAG TPA: tetratricopeptide repeat protein [Candidatus Acidoferrales bacterium]|nr:tetratricopeptide repeat protein [Candidatus Acidoferrales bacterium]